MSDGCVHVWGIREADHNRPAQATCVHCLASPPPGGITYPPPDVKEGSNMAPQMRWEAPQPVHKQTPEEFWDRIAQIEQHDPYNKRWKPKEPETHVDRIVMESFSDRQRGDKLLGRYPNADHPDIGAQERSGWATYVYISEPHTMADCPFGEDGRRKQ